MKKILLLLVTIAFAGCSGDDGPAKDNGGNGGTEEAWYLSGLILQATNGFNQELSFTYNEQKQMTGFAITGGEAYTITYDGNKPASIISANNYVNYAFGYEGDRLTTITKGETVHEVVFDAAQNRYTIAGLNKEFDMDDEGNIVTERILGQGAAVYPLEYDMQRKGALYSQPTQYRQLVFLLLGIHFVVAKRPVTMYRTFMCTNTYDENDYITKAVMDQGEQGFSVANYRYVKL